MFCDTEPQTAEFININLAMNKGSVVPKCLSKSIARAVSGLQLEGMLQQAPTSRKLEISSETRSKSFKEFREQSDKQEARGATYVQRVSADRRA